MGDNLGRSVDEPDNGESQGQDRAHHQEKGAEYSVVITLFLIDRDEPRDRLVQAKGSDNGTNRYHLERIGQGAEVVLREIADRQNLDRQVEHQGEQPAKKEETGAPNQLLGMPAWRARSGSRANRESCRRHLALFVAKARKRESAK